MQLKSYLRGLGTGIFISAVLMGIALSFSKTPTMSDDEIRERALKLGMVEENKIIGNSVKDDKIDIVPDDSETSEEVISAKPENTKATDSSAVATVDSTATEAPAKIDISVENSITDDDPADVKEPDNGNDNTVEESPDDIKDIRKTTFTLEIAAGTSSDRVAQLLQKGGVIKDASDFDSYLCDNHYDNRINHGVFQIPDDADYETIAKIITGNR